MEKIVKKQRDFFNTNATKDVDFRKQQLRKLKMLLKQNEDALNEAIYNDFKKSKFCNYISELSILYNDVDEALKNVKKWSKVKKVRTNLLNLPAKSYIIPEPLGVSLVIGAWNYPYQLSLAPAIAAIAAGNTVVLKPSELPKNTSNIMAKLINENFDPEFFKVIEGGIPETKELLDQKFDKVFFTGSTYVGKIVYQAAAKHLTPVTLELGGKSPAFFTEKCDLKIGVKRMIWAKFLNAGQTCVAPDYILVHKAIKDEFLKTVKSEIENSHFAFKNDNYVQIINESNMHRLIALLDENKVYTGGKYDIKERYFEPTVLTDVTFEDVIMQEEIFGPILPVIEYDDLDDAIAKVKSKSKPLSLYLFTKDKRIKQKLLKEISFGGGAINEAVMHLTNSNMPFGGVGESGTGNYHGENGFQAFSHYKSIMDRSTLIEPNLKHYPRTDKKLKLIKMILGQK
ncbi:MAG: aldehyde dehydrogenase family protein [Bacteroidota bacterium]